MPGATTLSAIDAAMFDVGFSELLLIGVVALVVLGPERLPGAARTVGALLRRARSSWASVRSEVERELAAEDMKNTIRDVAAVDPRAELGAVASDIAAALDPVRSEHDRPAA